jgi:hypothetical protein
VLREIDRAISSTASNVKRRSRWQRRRVWGSLDQISQTLPERMAFPRREADSVEDPKAGVPRSHSRHDGIFIPPHAIDRVEEPIACIRQIIVKETRRMPRLAGLGVTGEYVAR